MRTLMWGGCWGFYSSEVLPPFLVAQVFSLWDKSCSCSPSPFLVEQVLFLQTKSFPCRASLILVGQVFSLWDKSCPCNPSPFLAEQVFRNLKRGGQVWAFVLSGTPHKEWARPSFGPWTWSRWARQALSHILSSSHLYSHFVKKMLHDTYKAYKLIF